MSNYTNITGYIEDIYEGKTANDKSYLGIRFYTQDQHENDTGRHEIRWWFTANTVELNRDKIGRLMKIAGVAGTVPAKPTIAGTLKLLSKEEFAALKIPITVQVDEYEDKLRAQYDLGWDDSENVVRSGFSSFQNLVADRLAAIKGQAATPNQAAAAAPSEPEDASPYEDDIPF